MRLIRNEDLRLLISHERVKKGTPVWVEYTIVGYNGNAATKEDTNSFKPGVTLRLLSINMLSGTGNDSRYNFGSLKKRSRREKIIGGLWKQKHFTYGLADHHASCTFDGWV
jgi:hypothetical protein